MKKAPQMFAEPLRLAALKGYDVLDTLREAEYDDITSVAAAICSTPIALVSLIDADRQWFKSKVGLEASETPRDISFCGHAIAGTASVFTVNDAREDERFRDNPLVTGDPFIRFYTGVQLRTPDGYCIGTLCIADREPRRLTDGQEQSLIALGRIVMRSLGTRRTLAALRESHATASAAWAEADASKR